MSVPFCHCMITDWASLLSPVVELNFRPKPCGVPPVGTLTLSAAARMVSGVTEPEAAAPGSTYLTRS